LSDTRSCKGKKNKEQGLLQQIVESGVGRNVELLFTLKGSARFGFSLIGLANLHASRLLSWLALAKRREEIDSGQSHGDTRGNRERHHLWLSQRKRSLVLNFRFGLI